MKHLILTCVCFLYLAGYASPVRSNMGGRNTSLVEEKGQYPYDSEVEYLESTGTQYIDTGLTFNTDCAFEFNVNAYRSDSYYMFGYNYQYEILLRPYITWYFLKQYQGWLFSRNRIFHIEGALTRDGGILMVDGEVAAQNDLTPSPNMPMYLFAIHDGRGKISYCIVRFYYFKAVHGDVSVDMIPVRFTNEFGEREGAMYDRVSGEFFRNQGTGSFGIGPDV